MSTYRFPLTNTSMNYSMNMQITQLIFFSFYAVQLTFLATFLALFRHELLILSAFPQVGPQSTLCMVVAASFKKKNRINRNKFLSSYIFHFFSDTLDCTSCFSLSSYHILVDFIWDLELNRSTATWNLSFNDKLQSLHNLIKAIT